MTTCARLADRLQVEVQACLPTTLPANHNRVRRGLSRNACCSLDRSAMNAVLLLAVLRGVRDDGPSIDACLQLQRGVSQIARNPTYTLTQLERCTQGANTMVFMTDRHA